MEDMNKAESENAGRKKGETVYECDASKRPARDNFKSTKRDSERFRWPSGSPLFDAAGKSLVVAIADVVDIFLAVVVAVVDDDDDAVECGRGLDVYAETERRNSEEKLVGGNGAAAMRT